MKNAERGRSYDSTQLPLSVPPWVAPGEDVESALWESFAQASTREAFCACWLAIQCRIVGGVSVGVVLWRTADGESMAPLAVWPNSRVEISHLAEAAARAATERRGLIVQRSADARAPESPPTDCDIAFPLEVGRRLRGVVVLSITPSSEAQLRSTLRKLQWGFAWLEVMVRAEDNHEVATSAERSQAFADTTAAAVGRAWSRGAADFAAALATKFSCVRVSLGLVQQGAIEIVALSPDARPDQNARLLRAIGGAMQEALEQKRTLIFPGPDEAEPLLTHAHAELSEAYDNGAICSVPIRGSDGLMGAVTLERPRDQPFDSATVVICEDIVSVAGPMLLIRPLDDEVIGTSAQERFSGSPMGRVARNHASKTDPLEGIANSIASIMRRDANRGEPRPKIDWKNAWDGFGLPLPVKVGIGARRDQNLAAFTESAYPPEFQVRD